ncbi:MAG: AAA family ATPase, partial [Candidatus Thermoplasmatota archaeon]
MIGQSKFVGRVSEFKELTSYLDELVSEKGNVVFITGEAGVGKTRLVHELGDRAKELEIRFLSGRCLYSEGADPYLPFIECLKGISEEKKEMRGLPVGLMPLALPEEGKKEKRRLDPSELVREKDKMFENVTTLLLSMAKDEPIILFIDDLHWADNATIHLLYYIIRNTQQSRILIICCYRPEEIVAIEGKQHPLIDMLQRMSREITIKTIELGRLSYEETTEMVSSILRRKELPAGFSKLLYDETDGNPYYIEEVLKTLVDEGIINLRDPNWHEKLDIAQIKIPSTVKDVISRRIEKLSEDSVKVLGHASVIGQEFTFDVLVHTAEMPEEKVVECLDELIDAKLIYESF